MDPICLLFLVFFVFNVWPLARSKSCEKGAVNQSAASAAFLDSIKFQAVIKSAAGAASQIQGTQVQGSAWTTVDNGTTGTARGRIGSDRTVSASTRSGISPAARTHARVASASSARACRPTSGSPRAAYHRRRHASAQRVVCERVRVSVCVCACACACVSSANNKRRVRIYTDTPKPLRKAQSNPTRAASLAETPS